MALTILLIEDDPRFAKRLSGFLRKEDHAVDHAVSGEEGVRMVREHNPDVVLLDLKLPGISGMETLEEIRKINDAIPVIVVTGHASVTAAVEAMRIGAADFLTKPIDLEALLMKIDKTRELVGLKSDLDYLLHQERRGGSFEDFVGDCDAMQAVYQQIRDVAKTDNTTVLATGPSGTGKELVARAIHSLSSRSKKPLVQIDCTALPFALMESELFGHERGAFTGADRAKKGLLEVADGGTILLDEVGDMALELQSKFLRVLQERQFRRVGGTRDLRFDVRVIGATNQNLDELCEEGRFRRDLMYRLKVFEVKLPPLRQRGEDILALADSFVTEFARSFRKPLQGFEPDARVALLEYSFPGNVRELKNIIEQAAIRADGTLIRKAHLSIGEAKGTSSTTSEDSSGIMGLNLEELGETPLLTAERELIRQALEKSGGSKKEAANLLGISRFSLQRKLEKLTLELLQSGKGN